MLGWSIAIAAAWGEFIFGAGRQFRDIVAVTVGTGIGGGLILEGRLRRGSHGVASEVGHLNAVPDGRPCSCGRRGCLEQYASGHALVREAREGDPDALESFAVVGTWLGRGLADLAAVIDPEAFIVGGGVSEAGELLLARARSTLTAKVIGKDGRPVPPVIPASLGNRAGLVGAADLARRTDESVLPRTVWLGCVAVRPPRRHRRYRDHRAFAQRGSRSQRGMQQRRLRLSR